ncbi:unnamed protein product [Didymodactylos carnosus]|uniref:CCHC-type domain-containing protein n=1 Tax=Didymodactylos carnosus TaxID=1234261 RepID=A0A814GKH8_9BILA|nr:unnamed protein product [Didymodactylos carnosus]CAF0997525.1 unnamed protein product [Didymodactylos carnosus]CAF3557391.1 unnamed protein product [Didymodactylos carnosus]CAF3769090.1 unnamed protein product [Didymodactylos carnosus]
MHRRRSSDSRANGFYATETAKPSGGWNRVRNAYTSGQLSGISYMGSPSGRRRRNAAADTSAVSTTNNSKCQKHRFLQLVERVRELEHEIAPELHLYQGSPSYGSNPSTYSSLPTPSSTTTAASYPPFGTLIQHSGVSASSLPRNALSSRIVEKAHQIPERFWLDWYEKQMQEKIAELEYIRENLGCSPHSLLNRYNVIEHQQENDIRRKSVLFLYEAQRLANKRRQLLGRSNTVAETNCTVSENDLKQNNESSSVKDRVLNKTAKLLKKESTIDNDGDFLFEQRSDTISENSLKVAPILNNDDASLSRTIPEEKESHTDLDTHKQLEQGQHTPNVNGDIDKSDTVEHFSLDRSHLSISLPFTYTECRPKLFNPEKHLQVVKRCTLTKHQNYIENVIECSESYTQREIPKNISVSQNSRSDTSADDIAQIKNDLNIMSISLQGKTQPSGLETLYTKSLFHTTVEFSKSQLSNITKSQKETSLTQFDDTTTSKHLHLHSDNNKQFLYDDDTSLPGENPSPTVVLINQNNTLPTIHSLYKSPIEDGSQAYKSELPQQLNIIMKFVDNNISLEEVKEGLNEQYSSIYTIENMVGTMNIKARNIRFDMRSSDEYETILNKGKFLLAGRIFDVDEFLPSPKLLICSRCNYPGHMKKNCNSQIDICRRCGEDRNNGINHQECIVCCTHREQDHEMTNFRCSYVIGFQDELLKKLKSDSRQLPPNVRNIETKE